ncbi:uncharacterized protein LOC128962466 [Oppia nitens]|uniref:uncharacterized protein LOC128962466 n=1 Tax=Oppia nitens TaxID=1686743 RepID=UPI0023DC7286|nr:uncharacterized protein LOC128962466 [Oppia nitens]
MPVDAVWVIITVPRKEYEKNLKKIKLQNSKNLNISDDSIDDLKKKNESEIYMEKILSDSLEELQIEDVVWVPTRNGNYFQVYFPCELYENDSILHFLKSKGFGTKAETSIGYIPFNLFFYEELGEGDDEDIVDTNYDLPYETDINNFDLNHNKKGNTFKEITQNFLKSVTSRLTVAQVVEGVKSGSEVTFDFCAYTIFAGFIAAFGLINNDPVNIAASMMIEPIMGTVMAMTFGLVIEDRKLFMLGVKSNIISLILCLVSGFIMGLIIFIPTIMFAWNPPPGVWPTPEMQGRGTLKGIIYGIMIALPCGGAIAVTLLNDNQAALVGVAVASTFLPPFINTGLLWALSTHLQIMGLGQQPQPYNISGTVVYMKPAFTPQEGYSPYYSFDMRIENALLGCVSMALTGVNIVCMLIVAFIVLKIKEIVPLNKMEAGTQRFFKHDIKIARQHNRKSLVSGGRRQTLGEQILNEWAEISGLNKNQVMSNSPEAKVTQFQTLYDIAQDVEMDETFQTVMSKTTGNPNKFGLGRRLTQPMLFGNDCQKNVTQTLSPQVWSIENEMSENGTGRRYTVNPTTKAKGPHFGDNSPYSTVGYTTGRGIRPNDLMSERGRRRSTHFLRKSLTKSNRSPFSLWPTNQSEDRSNSIASQPARDLRARRQTSYTSNLDNNFETIRF